jgi:hypothetical protein
MPLEIHIFAPDIDKLIEGNSRGTKFDTYCTNQDHVAQVGYFNPMIAKCKKIHVAAAEGCSVPKTPIHSVSQPVLEQN